MRPGQSFEIEVKEELDREIKAGNYGTSKELIKTFLHKEYYSKDRDKPIDMDVSIEFFRQGADEPYIIWVWECKDYTGQVPIDDVEEFHAKLEQVGVHKFKGTVACRKGFQKSVLNYARSYGIGLARIRPDGSIVRLMENATPEEESITECLTQADTWEEFRSLFYGLTYDGKRITSLDDFIIQQIRAFSS